MSHASYSFLLSLSDLEASETALLKEALNLFEPFTEDRFDENNWWTPLFLSVANRGLFAYEGVEDPRSAHDRLADIDAAYPNAFRFAFQCVATEFELFGRSAYGWPFDKEGRQRDPLDNACLETMPRLIDAAFKQKVKDLKQKLESEIQDKDLRSWLLKRTRKGARLSRKASHPPFTTDLRATPYDYRAFDATGGNAPNAVLLVDVHT